MKKISKQSLDLIFKILDGISSVVVLPFAICGLFQDLDERSLRYCCAAFFFSFTISFIFQVLRKRNNSEPYGWQLVQMIVYLVSIALILLIPGYAVSSTIITGLFAAMLLVGRVLSIIKEHTYRNIIFNVACILLIIAAMIFGGFLYVCLYMLAVDLVHIVSLSFSGMDMKILMKVIRKSYVVDVITGLILFITAFSFVFPVLEPNISTYRDALWYCFAIVTTIGFGDFSAMSDLGRVLSVILGIYGIVVVALVTSVVVNFYSEIKSLPEEDETEES